MKEYLQAGAMFVIVALILLLAVGAVGADSHIEAEGEVEPTWADHEFWPLAHPVQGEAGQEVSPSGSATRINFEQSEDSALEGWYVVQEVDGPMVAAWYAYDGWQDSGWIDPIDLTKPEVHVRVLFYPPDSDASTEPTVMKILNHAPKKEYGWLAKDVAHALEVEFPD